MELFILKWIIHKQECAAVTLQQLEEDVQMSCQRWLFIRIIREPHVLSQRADLFLLRGGGRSPSSLMCYMFLWVTGDETICRLCASRQTAACVRALTHRAVRSPCSAHRVSVGIWCGAPSRTVAKKPKSGLATTPNPPFIYSLMC